MNRVSMAEIARHLGVAQSTVSRALRNDSRLKPETIARVQETAREMGYALDLETSHLFSRVLRRQNPGVVLGLVHNKAGEAFFQDGPGKRYWDAAMEMTRPLAVGIAQFCLQDHLPQGGRAVSRILKTRGIRGLLLCPWHEEDITHWELEWENFALVSIGSCPRNPSICRVDTDDFENDGKCLAFLARQGCRRIGYVSNRATADHCNWQGEAAHWAFCHRQGAEAVPPFLFSDQATRLSEAEIAQFFRWIEKNRVDGLLMQCRETWGKIVTHGGAPLPLERVAFGAKAAGDAVNGIVYHPRQLVQPAIQLLLQKLHLHDYGLEKEIARSVRISLNFEETTAL